MRREHDFKSRLATGNHAHWAVNALVALLAAVPSGLGSLYMATHSLPVTVLAAVLTAVLGGLVIFRGSPNR